LSRFIVFFLATLLFLAFPNKSYCQDSTVNIDKNPVKAMFFRRYVAINDILPSLNYSLKNKLFKQYRQYKPSLNPNKWELSFEDNFDSINRDKWRLGQPWGYYHDISLHQHYSVNQVWADSGYLHLGANVAPRTFKHHDTDLTIQYAIGLINSDISFQQKYGYFEIRCKNPSGPATWPAFWLTGAHRWPPEIDIFEMYGKSSGKTVHKQIASVHYGVSDHKSRGTLVKRLHLLKNTDTEFHTYACKWTPKYIKFYTDGVMVRKHRITKRLRPFMDDEMVIIINNGLEAKYLKYLPQPFTGNVFIVDYVRVYRMR
jgi:beta-glucanase (GH16 family)